MNICMFTGYVKEDYISTHYFKNYRYYLKVNYVSVRLSSYVCICVLTTNIHIEVKVSV